LHAGFAVERLAAVGRGLVIERLTHAHVSRTLRLLRRSLAGLDGTQAALGGAAQLCQPILERVAAFGQAGASTTAGCIGAPRLTGVDRPLALRHGITVACGERLDRSARAPRRGRFRLARGVAGNGRE
jgi:hypothetical protein